MVVKKKFFCIFFSLARGRKREKRMRVERLTSTHASKILGSGGKKKSHFV